MKVTNHPPILDRASAAGHHPLRAGRNGRQGEPANVQGMSTEQIQRLVQDLEMHRIELEMQNEELRRAQVELPRPGTFTPISTTSPRSVT
jgi:hypothetical protein